MNALMQTGSAPPTMSSREIAELTGKEHRNVLRDARAMLTELHGEGGVLSFEHTYRDPQNGQTYPMLALPKRETLILVSGYSVVMRAKIIDRWQELEARPAALNPANMSRLELLQMAMQAEQERMQLEAEKHKAEEKLAIAAPKAAALDRISASAGTLTITEAAKVLGVKREQLTAWMHANGWIYRLNKSWVGYQTHIQSGDLEYKEATYTDDSTGQEASRPYCHITQKGIAKLAKRFARQVTELA